MSPPKIGWLVIAAGAALAGCSSATALSTDHAMSSVAQVAYPEAKSVSFFVDPAIGASDPTGQLRLVPEEVASQARFEATSAGLRIVQDRQSAEAIIKIAVECDTYYRRSKVRVVLERDGASVVASGDEDPVPCDSLASEPIAKRAVSQLVTTPAFWSAAGAIAKARKTPGPAPTALVAAAPAPAPVPWPTLASPPAPTGGGERDVALIVAIERYAVVPGVPGAVENGNAWYTYLTRTRGVPVASVVLLRDSEGTVEKIRRYAADLATRAQPGGTAWLVFIGHGAPAPSGKDGVLVGFDAQQDAEQLYARSVPQGEVLAALAKGAQTSTVAVVDACFSGRLANGAPLAPGLQPLIAVKATPPGNATVLTAGRSNEFAGPLPGAARPAFSYLVLGGLRGWADANRDRQVTAEEAATFARDTLRTLVKDRLQTPELSGNGTLVLARQVGEAAPDLGAFVLGGAPPQTTTTAPRAP